MFASRLSRTNSLFNDARDFAEAAQAAGASLGEVSLRPGSKLELGAAYLALGEYRRAASLFREMLISSGLELSRQDSSAQEHLLRSAWLFHEMRMQPWLDRVQSELGAPGSKRVTGCALDGPP